MPKSRDEISVINNNNNGDDDEEEEEEEEEEEGKEEEDVFFFFYLMPIHQKCTVHRLSQSSALLRTVCGYQVTLKFE